VDLTAQHDTPLHFACFRGKPEIARLLLDHGAQVDVKSYNGETLLHLVSRGDHETSDDGVRIAELLLERGTDVNALNESGWTPLHYASINGKDEIAQVLLSHGANVNTENYLGQTPLRLAPYFAQDSVRITQVLLDRGADVNAQDKGYRTPLHSACHYGRFEIARVLLDHGAKAEAVDDERKTPLHHVSQGDYESKEAGCRIVELLLERGVDMNARDMDQDTPLHAASRCGRLEIVKLLLGYATVNNAQCSTSVYPGLKGAYIFTPRDESCLSPHSFLGHGADVNALAIGWTPLHYACCWGRFEIAQMLLHHGAKLILETSQETALHAVANGKYERQEDGARVAQLLLYCGVDADARDKHQRTPLHVASTSGKLEIMWLLLNHGAAVNATDDRRETPLHKVPQGGHKPQDGVRIAQLLLEHGGDVNAYDWGYWLMTPLHVTCYFGQLEIAQLLLEYGANVGASNWLGETPLHEISHSTGHCSFRYHSHAEVKEEICVGLARLLLKHGADVDAQAYYCRTPLHIASSDGKLEISHVLLEHGANVNASGEDGQTPLHLISMISRESCGPQHDDLLQLLLEHGADVNAKASVKESDVKKSRWDGDQWMTHCWTPFLLACDHRQYRIAQFLLEHGANVNDSTTDGETPLHLISETQCDSEDVKFALLLLEHGAEVNAQTKWKQKTPLHLASDA
jgi:ankyrin repeat protein